MKKVGSAIEYIGSAFESGFFKVLKTGVRIFMVISLYPGFMMGKSDTDIFQEHSEFDSEEGFGLRLATLRKARGFTQVELARTIGVTQRVITYYERETTRPPAHLLDKICKALEISADEFYGLASKSEDFRVLSGSRPSSDLFVA